MVTKDGPKVLEYNVRFGDPETQTLLPLLHNDLAELIIACTEHWLDAVPIRVKPGYSATVVAAAKGYPGAFVRGQPINLDPILSDVILFHAGTKSESNKLVSNGGRVIAATSTACTLEEAISSAYTGISAIHFPAIHYRKDIGHRALKKGNLASARPIIENSKPQSYASAGVSIAAGNELVHRITPLVASTSRPGASAIIGGFGGLFDLSDAGYSSAPVLIGAIDGVGTKLKIAHAMNKHDTVGIDLVAMNVNDLVVQGAEPLFFLDCYSCGKLDVGIAAEFIKGLTIGCREARSALVGGETAEMPGLFPATGHVYDVVGAAVGAIHAGTTILPDKTSMTAGDILLGLVSNGCHSNGFSLIRQILATAQLSYHDPAPWDPSTSVGASLLTPTRIYVRLVLPLVRSSLVKGMAHITGGGLLDNVPRMLPPHLAARMHAATWRVPPVMAWLKTAGAVPPDEFARVFNTGLGMVLVVAASAVDAVRQELARSGEEACVVGEVVPREDGEQACVVTGMEAWS